MKTRIAILASGGGTNLQALVDAWRAGQFPRGEIVLGVSDRAGAKALQRAERAGVATRVMEGKSASDRQAYDRALTALLQEFRVDLVCLAGFMRILSPLFVSALANRIMNIHPSLLPAFGGEGMYGRRVHEAVIASGTKISGCTVHFVDEGTDTGPIILQRAVPVKAGDTPESLAERVLVEEHRLYPRAVSLFCEGRLKMDHHRVLILDRA